MAKTKPKSKLRRKGVTVHGSIYPGANKLQDARYAALVAENVNKRKARKREEEAAA